MEGDGSDETVGHFILSGIMSQNRKVKFFITFDSGENRYFSGAMRSDLKMMSGNWGLDPENVEDIYRLVKSEKSEEMVKKVK